ncbi:MAG: hypothetical protein DRN03_02955, partial [Thermoplasmata archaeon]
IILPPLLHLTRGSFLLVSRRIFRGCVEQNSGVREGVRWVVENCFQRRFDRDAKTIYVRSEIHALAKETWVGNTNILPP